MRTLNTLSVYLVCFVGLSPQTVVAFAGESPLKQAAPMFIAAIGALFAAWLAFRILVVRKKK